MSALDDLAQALQLALHTVDAALADAASARQATDKAVDAAQYLGRLPEVAGVERLRAEVDEATGLLTAARDRFADALQQVTALQAGTAVHGGGSATTTSRSAVPASGWDVPGVADHPQRPDSARMHLPDDRRRHVLDGDPGGVSGGHRHGTGRPRKTEFPARWDDDSTAGHVLSVARNPDVVEEQQPNGRWRVNGVRDGVTVTAVIEPDGTIWTAWPKPGGRGVVQNPKER